MLASKQTNTLTNRHVHHSTLGWQHGVAVSGVCRMNEVNPRRAQLVLGWVTVFGWVYYLSM